MPERLHIADAVCRLARATSTHILAVELPRHLMQRKDEPKDGQATLYVLESELIDHINQQKKDNG